ncbi:MAG TPA: glycosyltransferase [Acidimicrobiales bacterium]|jgi:D-inositol-3-phosphate glycosyltransferase|nr:glycosyltransferase [Acidimicrobiales bacterium]
MTPDRIAILSMHTSPLAQPGTGDGGGMNVYVRELATALARSGVACEVFTRAEDQSAIHRVVSVEPGFRVHHVPAGPAGPVPKEKLPGLVDAWTTGVGRTLTEMADAGRPVAALHANYWLSGVAGHTLKHQLELPLLVTFHTLDRVKADASPASEPEMRATAEAQIVGCADSVLASCTVEADQLVDLYGADPERIALVAPGVEHAFFAPGDTAQARRAVDLPSDRPVILFVGRIQPLKGPTVAVEALAALRGLGGPSARATLVLIGGPSGPLGAGELAALRRAVAEHGLDADVRMLPPQPHEKLSTYFRAADACVVPSHSESFGLVALEAGACGVPVVAAAVGGLTTIVQDGETGFLVEGRDPADYAKPLAVILEQRDVAARMGERAAARARSYTWQRAAEDLWARVGNLTRSELVACG